MNNPNVPYSVISEGSLSYFKEGIPLWTVVLMNRVHHFNSRRREKYALYLDKDSIKLRVRPDELLLTLDVLRNEGDIYVDKVNAGLYLIQMSEDLLKKLDLLV